MRTRNKPTCLGFVNVSRHDAWPVFLAPEPIIRKADGKPIAWRTDHATCIITISPAVRESERGEAAEYAAKAIRRTLEQARRREKRERGW